jgi:hypothetical protein
MGTLDSNTTTEPNTQPTVRAEAEGVTGEGYGLSTMLSPHLVFPSPSSYPTNSLNHVSLQSVYHFV